MAEKVIIDIPGIGKVEAENAASEATLKKLLDAINKNNKTNKANAGRGGGGGGGFSGGGAAGGGAGGGGGGAQAAAASKGTKALNALGAAGAGAGYALGTAAKASKAAGGALVGVAEKSTQLIGKFAAVGDSLTAAADIFSGIPIIGTMFSAVASAVESTISAYSAAAGSGASFGGSLNNFKDAASAAGMSMQDFGNLIRQSGPGLLAFGSTTESGAQNFGKISQQLKRTGSDLYALGYGTKEINQGLVNYGELLRKQGLSGTKSNAELAKGASNYLKEIDLLAKATGEERSSIEAKMKQLATDAQFQSFMSTKNEDVQTSFNSLITRLGPTLGNFAKDFITTGTLTSEATQKIGSMYGQQALDELQRLRNKAQANQKATAEDSDRTVGVMIREGKRVQTQFGQVLAQSSGAFDEVAKANMDSNNLQADAMKKGTAQQKKAAEAGDGMAKAVNDAKSELARFSNDFSMVLVNSGLLNTLMEAFKFTANFVLAYVVPMFHVLVASVSAIVGSFLTSFGPAINGAGGFFNGVLIPAIQAFTNFLVIDLIPAVAKTFNDLQPVLIWLAGAVMTVAKFITDNLTAVLVTVGIGLLAYYGIVVALTIANFLEVASKNALVIATWGAIQSMSSYAASAIRAAGSMAWAGVKILASGLMAAAGFLIAIWPITLLVAAIGATVYIFKKFGGDLSVVKDGLLIMWEGYKMFLNYFKLGLLKVLDYFLDMGDQIEQTEKDIAANKQEAVDRATNIEKTMSKNRQLAQDEELAEEKRERDEEARKRKMEEMQNQKPPAPPSMPSSPGGGGMGGGGGGSTASGPSAPELPGMDYNLTGDASLKQFAERQKASPMAGGDAARKQLETDGVNKQQAEAAAAKKKAEEDKKKTEEDTNKKKEEEKGKKPESAETLLAELNTKMATLLKYTFTVAHNTNENVSATRSLNNNVYKA